MTMQITWLGTPAEKKTPRVQAAGLGLYDHLGAPPGMLGGIPWYCWEENLSGGFKQCHAQSMSAAQSICGGDNWKSGNYSSFDDCVKKQTTMLTEANCLALCKGCPPGTVWNPSTKWCDPKPPPGGVNPPCNSTQIIKSVQEDLGRPATGFWTEDDQGALIAAGYGGPDGFTDFAPVCSGPAPVATKPGGGGGGPAPVPPKPTPTTSGDGSNWGLVLLALAAGVGILWSQG